MLLCIFLIFWPSILCSLQLFKSIESTRTVIEGKLKYTRRHIICIYVTYVTNSIRHRCMLFNIKKN